MKNIICLTAVSISALALVGCSNSRNVSYGHITGDLTPEMKGLSERPSDDHTAMRVAQNANMRMFWDDLGRALMFDSPNRLHPYPIIDTSGQGR